MSQLDQLPAGAVVRARPWDVTGAALTAPMVLWGFLGWFGTAGDSGGGSSGFYSGAGSAGIALVFAAGALAITQIMAGRPHSRTAPPVSALLAGAAVIVILGGMVAKPDSATIEAGSVAGLLTALSQGVALTVGWLTGSEKAVKAANVRAVDGQQAAADLAAATRFGAPPTGYGYPPQPVPGQYPYGQPRYGPGGYPPVGGPPPGYQSGPPGGPPPGYQSGPPGGPPPGYPYR